VPQVHGATKDTIVFVSKTIKTVQKYLQKWQRSTLIQWSVLT
jgi:hypothetical protein